MALTDQQRAEIHRYADTSHFAPSEDYVGFLSEDVVENPEAPIRELARKIEESPGLTTEEALGDAARALALYRLADTEDREQAARAVAGLLAIAKVTLPEGWLDEAVYGPL